MENKTKTILGLDLGTNSIGWALVQPELEKILGMGSRIIPMSADILGEFDKGNSISQTAERTRLRGVRRLRERHLLRRERLHRVLSGLGYLPKHYEDCLDRYGNIIDEEEPKIAYSKNEKGNHEFYFMDSFKEMVSLFKEHQPDLFDTANGDSAKIPYDWTIYYLRQKALKDKLSKEELAWLLLHFNQKRGYYQLRGEDEELDNSKSEDYYSLNVIEVKEDEKGKKEGEVWYSVILENGWIYRRSSRIPLNDWVGKNREFIVTTTLNEDGSVKVDKDGKEARSFRSPKDDDWGLMKKKTEQDILKSNKTVGQYIFEALLKNPKQKIKGKLVRTIERKFYKEELNKIVTTQFALHDELKNKENYENAVKSLYESNDQYRNSIINKDFKYLFVNDIIFYQRPLKSKKSEISNCPLESRYFKDGEGNVGVKRLKCIPKSHPLFQEFRLWQWLPNIKIFQSEIVIDGRIQSDVDVTYKFLKTPYDVESLFDFLNNRAEVDQKAILKYFLESTSLKGKALTNEIEKYRWNYIADKAYPCNETKASLVNRFKKVDGYEESFLTKENEIALWHILYSVKDKNEIEKALETFAIKNDLDIPTFVENFKRYPLIKSDYGAYSEKAIKKLLPLLKLGSYWNKDEINAQTLSRINNIINAEYDEKIRDRVREKAINLKEISDFQGLPLWLASYVVYDKHSEASDIERWQTIEQLENYINGFKQHSLRNPIVEQVLTESLRVVKDIWSEFGNGQDNYFDEIHIELGREMKNNAADRKSITENNNKNESTNIRIKMLLEEFARPEYNIENVRPYSPSQAEILKIYEDGALNSAGEVEDDIIKISKSSQPSRSEILRYKLWLEQRYRSPYTGTVIPLSSLFTPAYEIEHIIPQSIYFDDSFTNKIICESAVNTLKSNQFGYEFISNHGGEIVETGAGRSVKIFTKEQYEDFIKNNYAKSKAKMKKLLLEEVPEKMIERQLNDTRYISKMIKNILSNLVRSEQNDDGVTSKNIISTNGSITGQLKQDWGLNDVWNSLITPRFERMNALTNSNDFGYWDNKDGKKVFQTQVPIELQKGFNKKRIDHRHHALDALIISLVTRNHVNYLNNQNALAKDKSIEDKKKDRYDLKVILCDKVHTDKNSNYKWQFKKPWSTLTQDTKNALDEIIVSFKQNLRVINKTTNFYQKYVDGKKTLVKQTKGENWAIRKSLHKDTVAGQIKLQRIKEVRLSEAIELVESISFKPLRQKVRELKNAGSDNKEILKYFKDLDYIWGEKSIARAEIYYYDKDVVASRTSLDTSFNRKKIETITDTGIQKILLNHLSNYDTSVGGKEIENPDQAFSPEGIEEMNKNIVALNNGKKHQPIQKVRTYEIKGSKFNVGYTGNKGAKFVEAAKGTNLFFAIYVDEAGKRSYDTIGFNIVAERMKQGLGPIPDKENHQLLFHLSPNDLVYVPTEDEIENIDTLSVIKLTSDQKDRIYKFVSCTGNRGYFIQKNVSSSIVDKVEFSALNKIEKTSAGENIKQICFKLTINRLGF